MFFYKAGQSLDQFLGASMGLGDSNILEVLANSISNFLQVPYLVIAKQCAWFVVYYTVGA
jgi:hypothetical protein